MGEVELLTSRFLKRYTDVYKEDMHPRAPRCTVYNTGNGISVSLGLPSLRTSKGLREGPAFLFVIFHIFLSVGDCVNQRQRWRPRLTCLGSVILGRVSCGRRRESHHKCVLVPAGLTVPGNLRSLLKCTSDLSAHRA